AAALSLAALLLEHPYRDDEGLVHTVDRSVTAGDARRAARAVAGALGDRAGRAVAVQLPDAPELVSAMAGVWLAGGVYVPVNPRHPDAEVAAVLETTRPAAVLTQSGTEVRHDAKPYDAGVAFVMWTSGTTGRPKPLHHTHP